VAAASAASAACGNNPATFPRFQYLLEELTEEARTSISVEYSL
jgi:hypothetical protein